jgi:hypothetical protein
VACVEEAGSNRHRPDYCAAVPEDAGNARPTCRLALQNYFFDISDETYNPGRLCLKGFEALLPRGIGAWSVSAHYKR